MRKKKKLCDLTFLTEVRQWLLSLFPPPVPPLVSGKLSCSGAHTQVLGSPYVLHLGTRC